MSVSDEYLLYLITHTVTCYPILPRILVLILNYNNVSVNSFKMLDRVTLVITNVSKYVSI